MFPFFSQIVIFFDIYKKWHDLRIDKDLFLRRDFIYLFLERGEGREKEGESSIDVREKHRLVACHTSPDW